MRTLAIPCSCVGACTVAVIFEFEAWRDDPQSFWVEFYTQIDQSTRGGLRDRLRIAWGVLRRREPYVHSLTLEPPDVERIAAWLAECMDGRRS